MDRLRRRTTALSTASYKGRTVPSFQSRASAQQQDRSKRGSFPVYNLSWEQLRSFLEKKYEGHEFPEVRSVQNDKYLWTIPEGKDDLTNDDMFQIMDMRDQSLYDQPEDKLAIAKEQATGKQPLPQVRTAGRIGRQRSLSPEPDGKWD